VSIDDRIRTAIGATAATVREIPPLTLPPDPAPAGPGRRRYPRISRGGGGWLIPLAAAVAVIVVAAVLVGVRDLPGAGHPTGTPTGSGGGPAGLPRYGVVLTGGEGSGVQVSDLSVFDTGTGKRVAQVKHPAGFSFVAVSGAADDRTFVVSAVSTTIQPVPGTAGMQAIFAWYLLRIGPGTAQPVKLTRLAIPVQPGDAVINGIALSPDGRTLAVLEWCTVTGPCDPRSPGTLRLYSVATGKALRTWTWGASPVPTDPAPGYGDNENSAGLTWLTGGRTLAFTYYAHGQSPAVRTLDTTRPGGDLVTSSRRVFTLPASGPDACSEAQLTPDGQMVICGTQVSLDRGCYPVTKETLEIDAYSAATGKREGVLYRYTGPCTKDGVGALGWVGPGNVVVAMVDTGTVVTRITGFQVKVIVGVLTGGKFVPLLPATLPFGQGPGTIAF
jgi:hypothetical protein